MKIRSSTRTLWQSPAHQQPIYIDSAYKQLLRQQLKAVASKNRTKVLNINQEHILKQVQNNQSKLENINQVKYRNTQKIEILTRDKQKKSQMTQQLKQINQSKRKNHQKQMSSISIGKNEDREKIRDEAKRNRQENLRLIEQNRSQQLGKKRQIHNKIHDDIIQCRTTIKNFFSNKHDRIVQDTQQEVKKLNHKRINENLTGFNHSANILNLQNQVKQMKNTLKESRIGIELNRNQSISKLKKKEVQESHPLVRKIETVLNLYTKFF